MKSRLTLKEIDQQIAQLQEQAAKIKDAEKADVIGRMKEAIAYYGVTAAELGLALSRVGRNGPAKRVGMKVAGLAKVPMPAKKTRAGAGQVKFKDDAGHSWTGLGPKPRWFIEAMAAGKTADELKA